MAPLAGGKLILTLERSQQRNLPKKLEIGNCLKPTLLKYQIKRQILRSEMSQCDYHLFTEGSLFRVVTDTATEASTNFSHGWMNECKDIHRDKRNYGI